MATEYYIVPEKAHNELVKRTYLHRGYDQEEAEYGTRMCLAAAIHGVRTHNAIKALTYDQNFGQKLGACVPRAKIRLIPSQFEAVQAWDAGGKLGQAIAYTAMDVCMRLADRFGVGIVAVDRCFHYVWGGAYVLYAAEKGYIAYTGCTAPLAEVVPYKGKFPTLGTNPHSWGYPTAKAIGYPIVIDWATSMIARGAVEVCQREGKELPPGAALDSQGNPTLDPHQAAYLLPFGEHKGYSLNLIDELNAAFIGGSIPTVRGTYANKKEEKYSTSFIFQATHPDAISGKAFAHGRTQMENVKMILEDIIGHGNKESLLPGFGLAQAKALTQQHGGLLFTKGELLKFQEFAKECGIAPWNIDDLKKVNC